MKNKIIYFPMYFDGKRWQTEQALKEKKLICGWATTELYPLIKETYQQIKNGTDLNLLENKFRQEFTNIVSKEDSKYYKTDYFYWFFNKADKDPIKRIGVAWGSIFRFLLIKAGDLLYIKTKDDSIIHVAYIKDNSNISYGETYYNRVNEGEECNAFFLDNAEFSEPIKKNNLFEKCYALLSEKHHSEKDVLFNSLKHRVNLQGTIQNMFDEKNDKKEEDKETTRKLKEVFYEALNFYTNQEVEYKTDLRCEKIIDIIINHICKNKSDNANIIPIFYELLAEAMNNDKLEFDNHLTFNQRTPAKNSNAKIDGETKLGSLLGKIHYKCENLNIPHLNYLVVHKTDGKCGDGADFGLDEENERQDIWQYDWESYKYIENEIKSVDDDKNNTDIFQNISETRVESRVPFPSKFVDMVLNKYPNLKDKCQSCEEFFFEKEGGGFYFEIHHIKHYSKCRKEGINPHTIENCVALCPNCHKNEHFGKKNNRKFHQE